jgi:hypothetical protein
MEWGERTGLAAVLGSTRPERRFMKGVALLAHHAVVLVPCRRVLGVRLVRHDGSPVRGI